MSARLPMNSVIQQKYQFLRRIKWVNADKCEIQNTQKFLWYNFLLRRDNKLFKL